MTDKTEWVLVPREPTEAMLSAAHYELAEKPFSNNAERSARAYAAMLAAAPQPSSAAAGAEAGRLWCMHIIGPDEVHAAPSRAHAERAVQKFHEWYARQPKDELAPRMEAVVAPWPHDAKSHAEDVDSFIGRWLLPSGQVQALAQQGGA